MIRHMVSWRFKEGFSDEEKRHYAQKMKADLEALKTVIPGILLLEVIIDVLPSSNQDVLLNSLFESAEALAAYQPHPSHASVSKWVGTVMQDRTCIDFVES